MSLLSYYKPTKNSGNVHILGVPVDVGTDGHGGADAPAALRAFGLAKRLERAGFTVSDEGDVECPTREELRVGSSKMKYGEGIAAMARDAAMVVQEAVKTGGRMVAIGGDHAMSIGTIAGASAALEGEVGVIWIDAHADIHTDETTTSGNVHGMPSAAMMGLGNPLLANVIPGGKKVKPEHVVFIGLKDVDPEEIATLERLGITTVTMLDIAARGITPVMEAVDTLKSRVANVWVSQDIDAIDALDAPGTLMATQGGLSYREITNIARYVGRTCNVVGVDIAELVPNRDEEQDTTELAMELIMLFLGADYSWYTEYMDKYRGE